MQNNSAPSRHKKEISPKVTESKITITKSTPFLIKKHHLDDTQMRKALRHDSQMATKTIPRSYSYKGEVRTCLSSKIGDSSRKNHNQTKQVNHQEKPSEYYQPVNLTERNQISNQKYKYPPSSTQRYESNEHQNRQKKQKVEKLDIEEKGLRKKQNVHVTKIYENPKFEIKIDSIKPNTNNANDYGLKQMKTQHKNQMKESEKARKNHERKLKEELSSQAKKIFMLESQIDDLNIRNIQLEKKRLREEIDEAGRKKGQRSTGPQSKKDLKWNISLLIANKPKFKIKHAQNEDTDSSFSSFQLS